MCDDLSGTDPWLKYRVQCETYGQELAIKLLHRKKTAQKVLPGKENILIKKKKY